MRKTTTLLLCSLLILPFAFGEGNPAAKKLGDNLRHHVGEQVTFTDEVLHIWKNQPLLKKDKTGMLKFETRYVRCVLKQSVEKYEEYYAFIQERLEKIPPKVFTFTGTVIKKDEFEFYVDIEKIEHPKYLKAKDGGKESEKEAGKETKKEEN
jgi:hypothetical protein